MDAPPASALGSRPAATENRQVRVCLLGPVEATADGERLNLQGPRQQRLLAMLALDAGRAVSKERLIDGVWPDDDVPADPAATVARYVSRLRQALGSGDAILRVGNGYALDTAIRVDANDLDRAVHAGSTASRSPTEALAALDDALDRASGPALDGFAGESWAVAQAVRLDALRLQAIERRSELLLELGRPTDAIPLLEQATSEAPVHEGLHRVLMLALDAGGRRTEALRVYERYRRVVGETSGLEPSDTIRRLQSALLGDGTGSQVASGRQILTGYEIGAFLGEGPHTFVYRARQLSLDRDVCVKVVRTEIATSADFIDTFETGARRIARLEHPHIVPLYDYWRSADSASLVMRYLAGGSLVDKLARGTLPVAVALEVATEVASAVAFAHDHHIVHGAIGPVNVLFDEFDTAYLTDFAGPLYGSTRGDVQTGYAADVESLGHLLHAMLSGRQDAGTSSLAASRTDVPLWVDELVAVATAAGRNEGHPTAGSFLLALTEQRAGVEESASVQPRNPYKGLEAFETDDAKDFHGRTDLVTMLSDRIRPPNGALLAVVGPSGCGKSSLLRAGLVPALREQSDHGELLVVTTTPGSRPFTELSAALLRSGGPCVGLDDIDHQPDPTAAVVSALAAMTEAPGTRLVVIIDQFEELFTLAEPADQNRFLGLLVALATHPDRSWSIVFGIRADYWDRPLEHPEMAALLRDASVNVGPISRDDLHEAIVAPAARCGVAFEPALVGELIGATVGRDGVLPLLQFTLTELFDGAEDGVIRADRYRRLGGLAGALARRGERAFERLTPAAREAGPQVLTALVRLRSDGEETRTRLARDDLEGTTGATEVIEALGRARLLTFDRDPATGRPTVEVAHEALFDAWPRYRRWLDDARDALRIAHRVSAAAESWAEGGRRSEDLFRGATLEVAAEALGDKRPLSDVEHEFMEASRQQADAERQIEVRRGRRLHVLLAALAMLATVAVVAAALAVRSQRSAERSEREAIRERDAAVAAQEAAATARDERDEAAGDALRAQLDLTHAAARDLALEDPGLAALVAAELEALDPGTRSWSTLGHTLLAMPDWLGDLTAYTTQPLDADRLAAFEAGDVSILDRATLETLDRLSLPATADFNAYPAVAPDGARTAIPVLGGLIMMDLTTGETGEIVEVAGRGVNMAWLADGRHLIVPLHDSEVAVYAVDELDASYVASRAVDLDGPAEPLTVGAHPTQPIVSVAWSNTLEFWDASSAAGGILRPIERTRVSSEVEAGSLFHSWSPDGTVWAASIEAALAIEDGDVVAEIRVPGTMTGLATAVQELGDGNVFVGVGSSAAVLDRSTSEVIDGPWPVGEVVTRATEVMNGRALAISTLQGRTTVWSRAGGNPLMETLPAFHRFDVGVAGLFAFDVESGIGVVERSQVWQLTEESARRLDLAAPEPHQAVTLSRTDEGPVIGLVSSDGLVHAFDPLTGEELFAQEIDGNTLQVRMGPSRERVIIVSFPEPVIRVFDRSTGELLHRIDGEFDLRYMDIDERSDTAYYADISTIQQLQWSSLEPRDQPIPGSKPQVSDDGRFLIHRSAELDIVVTDLTTVETALTIEEAAENVMYLEPSGNAIVAVGIEKMGLWALADGTPLIPALPSSSRTLHGENGPAIVTVAGHAHVFNDDPTTWAAVACRAGGRSLTEEEWAAWLPDGVPYSPTC